MDNRYPLIEGSTDELLTRLVEEASEVIKEAMKIQRFGWDGHHPDGPDKTRNGLRLSKEARDFRLVWEELSRRSVL